MKRTYVDASVLIAAFKAKEPGWHRAMAVVDDPCRAFAASDYLALEVLPNPTFQCRLAEVEFMRAFLASVSDTVPSSPLLTQRALDLATKYNLSSIDALHVSAALEARVEELITLEKPSKPICQVKEIKVISIHM